MHLDRTRFKGDIVTEFAIPNGGSDKVIILCDGVPTVPSKKGLMRFLVKHGFSVFHPRYRGTWESSGAFLADSPHQDVLDVIDELPKGFRGLWEGNEYRIKPKQMYILCSSFGGPAGFFIARDPRVNKVIALSPVVDWTSESKAEPFNFFKKTVTEGYGGGYRISEEAWNKLKAGEFYNPVSHKTSISGEKIWVIHAEDDESVLAEPVKQFTRDIGCKLTVYKKGGHMGLSAVMKWSLWWRVKRFLKSKTG